MITNKLLFFRLVALQVGKALNDWQKLKAGFVCKPKTPFPNPSPYITILQSQSYTETQLKLKNNGWFRPICFIYIQRQSLSSQYTAHYMYT